MWHRVKWHRPAYNIKRSPGPGVPVGVAWGGPLLNEVSGIKDKTAGNIFCFEFLHVSSALSDGGRRCTSSVAIPAALSDLAALVLVYFHRLFLPLLLHDWPEKKTFAACRGERWSLSHSPASKNPFLRRERRRTSDYGLPKQLAYSVNGLQEPW